MAMELMAVVGPSSQGLLHHVSAQQQTKAPRVGGGTDAIELRLASLVGVLNLRNGVVRRCILPSH